MFDISLLINLFTSLIELNNIHYKYEIKEHTLLYLLIYLFL